MPPAVDAFVHPTSLQTVPTEHAFPVAPSDSAELAYVTRALYVGAGGDLAVVMAAGEQVTLAGVAGGSLLPFRVRQVRATGTTAGAIIGLY